MKGKKGDATTNFLIPLIIGIVLLLAVGYLIYYVGGIGRGVVVTADPGKLSFRAGSCATALNLIDYCRFSDVGEKKDTFFVNCQYEDENFQKSFENDNGYSCVENTNQNFCNTLEKNATINTGNCVVGAEGNTFS